MIVKVNPFLGSSLYRTLLTCIPDTLYRDTGKRKEILFSVLLHFKHAIANLIHQHLCSRKSCLLSIIDSDGNARCLILNDESGYRRVMRYLLTDGPSAILPVTEKLLSEDWVERLLFPLTRRHTTRKRAIQCGDEPLDSIVEALLLCCAITCIRQLHAIDVPVSSTLWYSSLTTTKYLHSLAGQPNRTYLFEMDESPMLNNASTVLTSIPASSQEPKRN